MRHEADNMIRVCGEAIDDELAYCERFDVVYQISNQCINYDVAYWDKHAAKKGGEIGKTLNRLRISMAAPYCESLLDFGIGFGEFIEEWGQRVIRMNGQTDRLHAAFGYDINPVAVAWLQKRNLFVDPFLGPVKVEGWTMWDVLEHVPNPSDVLSLLQENQFLFLSLPIIEKPSKVRASKHYKPGEHLYYFTRSGFLRFMDFSGFDLLEENDLENRAGREDIRSFSFRKRGGYLGRRGRTAH